MIAGRPFVEAGFVPRIIAGSPARNVVEHFPGGLVQTFSTYYANWSNDKGFVAGAGLEYPLGRLRLSPTVRYTRWSGDTLYGAYGGPMELFYGIPPWKSARNQVDILLGISWKMR